MRELWQEAAGVEARRRHLETEARRMRTIAIGATATAILALSSAIFIPTLFSHVRRAQSTMEERAFRCQGTLANFYKHIEEVVKLSGKLRSARNVRSNARSRVQQTIKDQSKIIGQARYLHQKLAEAAVLLSSDKIWQENEVKMGDGKGEEKRSAGGDGSSGSVSPTTTSTTAKGGTKMHRLADELLPAKTDAGGGEGRSSSFQRQQQFASSNSFEISAEHQHWHQQYELAESGRQSATTTTTTTNIFPRPSAEQFGQNAAEGESPFISAGLTVEPTYPTNNDLRDKECCGCSYGVPGPPGIPGADGQSGRDGVPGQNGPNGRDAPTDEQRPSEKDFCFSCSVALPGEPGIEGPKGRPGEVGPPGEDGPDGRMGSNGRRGTMGAAGAIGKVGITGKRGEPGKLIIVDGGEGPQGENGQPGLQGSPGMEGQPGNPGKQGKAGLAGESGFDGQNGAIGQSGRVGESGKPGQDGGCTHCQEPRTAPGY